jgi:hypothetical protein
MTPFVTTLFAIAGAGAFILWIPRVLRIRRACHRQVIFIGETLSASKPGDDRRIIVSLSTLPDRIANLRPTLECLLQQTRPPNEIVLALPEFSVRQQQLYVIPPFLLEFPALRILRARRDWGPATKSIPAIQDELAAGRLDTLIMIVDDDRIYPRDAVETYLYYSRQLPDAALCFRGAPMPRSFNWHESKQTFGNRLRAPKQVAVITGCGSYLVKPIFFDASFWDYSNAPRSAFYMDDIWISGSLDRRGVKKYVVPSSTRLRSVKQQAGTMTLHDVPKGRRANNNEVIEHFRAGWNVFPDRSRSR